MEQPNQSLSSTASGLLREFVRARSERAFAELVTQHINLVYSAALRQAGGDFHRAEEVTQMVFTDLAKKAAALANHPSLTGWLYTSTRLSALKLLRAERRRAAHEHAAAEASDILRPDESESANLDWTQMRPVLDDAMAGLGDADRDAVLLRFFENKSFAEVGARLGMGENTARMRVQRALEKLRAQLARRGVTSSAGALAAALATNAVSAAPAALAPAVSSAALGTTASAAGAGILTVAGILIMSKTTIAILSLGAAALVYLAVSQNNTQRALAHELATQQAQNDRAQRELADLKSQSQDTQNEAAQIEAAVAAAPGSAAKLEKARLTLLQLRTPVWDKGYAPLFRKLHLSPEKLQTLLGLMSERDTVRLKAVGMALKAGLTDYNEVVALAVEDVDNRVHDLLGDAGFDYFSFYMKNDSFWSHICKFNQGLKYINMPITDAQMEAIVKINADLCGDSQRIANENSSTRVWTDAEMAAVQKILTPSQFIVLQENNRTAAAQNQLMELNRQASLDGKIKSETFLESIMKKSGKARQ